MGEYEPNDSRIVTQNPSATPVEPERTGPREQETRGRKEQELEAERGRSKEDKAPDDADRWQVTDEDRRFEPGRTEGKDA